MMASIFFPVEILAFSVMVWYAAYAAACVCVRVCSRDVFVVVVVVVVGLMVVVGMFV